MNTHAVVWRYRVAPGREAAFEALYGADGDWARLFRQSIHYRGTELYRDVADPGVYLTIDRWESPLAYEAFLSAHAAEYAALDARGDALTTDEARLGELTDYAPSGMVLR